MVVDFSSPERGTLVTGPYASVDMNLDKEIRTWSGQRKMPVKLGGNVVDELFVRYYSPTETDPEYIAEHNLTSYQLGDSPFFLLLIVKPRGDNAGVAFLRLPRAHEGLGSLTRPNAVCTTNKH